MPVYIYALTDPRNDHVKYIGKTKNPKKRLNKHRMGGYVDELETWTAELEKHGEWCYMSILEEVPDDADPKISETYWVRYAVEHAWPILNKRTGGDNSPIHFITDPNPNRRIFRVVHLSEPTARLIADVYHMDEHGKKGMLHTALCLLSVQDRDEVCVVRHFPEHFQAFPPWWKQATRYKNGMLRISGTYHPETTDYDVCLFMKKKTGDLLDKLAARFVGKKRRGYDATIYTAFFLACQPENAIFFQLWL
jgi:hypothetical protein